MSKPAATTRTTIMNTTPWSSSFSKQPLQLNELRLPDYQNSSNYFSQEHPFLLKNSFKGSYQPSSKTSQLSGSKKRIVKKGITSFGWESLKNTWAVNENQPILEIVILEKQGKNMQKGYDQLANQKTTIDKDKECLGTKYFQGSNNANNACDYLAEKTTRNIHSTSTLDSEKNDYKRSYEGQLMGNYPKSQLPLSKPSKNSIICDAILPSLVPEVNTSDAHFLKNHRKSTAFLNPQTKITCNRPRFLSSAQALDLLAPSKEFSDQFLQTSRNSFKERSINQAPSTISLERVHKISLTAAAAAAADEPSKFHRSQSDLESSLKLAQKSLPRQDQIEQKQRSIFLVSSLVNLKSLSVPGSLLPNNIKSLSTYPQSNPVISNSLNVATPVSESLLPLNSVSSSKFNIQKTQMQPDASQTSIQGNNIIFSDKQQVQEKDMDNHLANQDPSNKKKESLRIETPKNAHKIDESISLPMSTATNLIKSKELPNIFQTKIPPNQPHPTSIAHNYPLSLSNLSNRCDKVSLQSQFLSNLQCNSARDFFSQQQKTTFQRFTNGFNQYNSRKASVNNDNNKQLSEDQHEQRGKPPISLADKLLKTNLSRNNETIFDSEEEDFFNYTQAIKQSRQSPSSSEHCERINQIGF